MKKLVIPIVVAVLATSGGVFALTRETEQTPLVQQNIEQAEVEQEEVSLPAPETPVVTPAEEVETEPVEEEPVDTRADWEKFLDKKLAEDENAQYVIQCIERNNSMNMYTPYNPSAWGNGSDRYKNFMVEPMYKRISQSIRNLTSGDAKRFADLACTR